MAPLCIIMWTMMFCANSKLVNEQLNLVDRDFPIGDAPAPPTQVGPAPRAPPKRVELAKPPTRAAPPAPRAKPKQTPKQTPKQARQARQQEVQGRKFWGNKVYEEQMAKRKLGLHLDLDSDEY